MRRTVGLVDVQLLGESLRVFYLSLHSCCWSGVVLLTGTLSEVLLFSFLSFSLLFCLLASPILPPLKESLLRALSKHPLTHIHTDREFFLNQLLIRTTMRASYRSPDLAFFSLLFSLSPVSFSSLLVFCAVWRLILARCGLKINEVIYLISVLA